MCGSAADGAWMRYPRPVLLLCLLLSAHAAAVSRLGGLFFYDPLTFDAGLLQQSVGVKGGADGSEGSLEVGGEVPFYRELSVRVGYQQHMRYGLDNTHRLSWRLRARLARSRTSALISTTLLRSAWRTTGVTSPSSMATATEMSTRRW